MIEKKWQCGRCFELHDTEGCAIDCCPPEVIEVYLCPTCGEECATEESAANCCDENAALLNDGSDPKDSRSYPPGNLPVSVYVSQFIEINHYKTGGAA